MPNIPLREKHRLIDVFRTILGEAQKDRGKHSEMVPHPFEPLWSEPAWIQNEREAMRKVINVERTQRGLADVDLLALIRVETMASGHVDYSSKFALYCVELALGIENPQP